MAPIKRKESEKVQLKKEILESAVSLASEKGWAEVSIRKISRKVHYSTIIIYSLFGSKEILFNELIELGFKKLLQVYKTASHETEDPRETILLITRRTVEFYNENKELYQLMFGVIGIQGVVRNCSETSSSAQSAKIVRTILEKIRKEDPASLFMNWWAIVHGFISIGRSLSDGEFATVLPFLDEAMERFLKV